MSVVLMCELNCIKKKKKKKDGTDGSMTLSQTGTVCIVWLMQTLPPTLAHNTAALHRAFIWGKKTDCVISLLRSHRRLLQRRTTPASASTTVLPYLLKITLWCQVCSVRGGGESGWGWVGVGGVTPVHRKWQTETQELDTNLVLGSRK